MLLKDATKYKIPILAALILLLMVSLSAGFVQQRQIQTQQAIEETEKVVDHFMHSLTAFDWENLDLLLVNGSDNVREVLNDPSAIEPFWEIMKTSADFIQYSIIETTVDDGRPVQVVNVSYRDLGAYYWVVDQLVEKRLVEETISRPWFP